MSKRHTGPVPPRKCAPDLPRELETITELRRGGEYVGGAFQGRAGELGLTGNQWVTGELGHTGELGPTGEQGRAGELGLTGKQGLTDEIDARHAHLDECTIADLSLDRLDLGGAVLADVSICALTAAVVRAREGRWRNVAVEGGRIGSLDLSDADLTMVELRGVRIDYLSLASATVADLRCVDCTFGAIDAPDARMERVAFEGCRADELDSRGLRATDTDMTGLDIVTITEPLGLRGVTLSEAQVSQHAFAFAAALGIRFPA